MWRWQLKTCWGCYCCSCWWWKNVLTTVWCRFRRLRFLFKLWAQGFKVWLGFWSWCSGKILKLKFGHQFAADAWLWLWSSILVEILKLGLVNISKLKFCPDFEHKVSRFGQDFEVDVEVRFWSWSLGIILLLMLGCGYEVQSWSRFWS